MSEKPFEPLGNQLRLMRERQQESLAEVSGAVEINIDDLERIESGSDRPSEEILSLLISHFNMQDTEAFQLWNLAGYDKVDLSQDFNSKAADMNGKQAAVMILAVDIRTMYSDSAKVTTSKNGLVMEFMQEASSGKGTLPVARVGMSLEQAEEVAKNINQAILRARYGADHKRLSGPQDTNSN